jgi:CBS domain-containing protein
MKARDVMTRMPAVLTPRDQIWKAAEIMKYEKVGCVPIVSDIISLRLVGVITDRDISVRCTARRHESGCELRAHMTPVPLQTVTPDAEVSEIVAKMEAAHVRRIPVVDRDGMLVGIVSEADLVTKLPERETLLMYRELRTAFRPPLARVQLLCGEIAAH